MGALIFVGLGLAGTHDITLRAIEAVKEVHAVYAEFYTSHLIGATHSQLERALGKRLTLLTREEVEGGFAKVLEQAKGHRVAFLTAGDPMTATTHQELKLRAEDLGISTRLVHGVSIQVAAAGAAGLQSYKFGRTTTLVFPQPNFNPVSPYTAIRENKRRGLHTLVLLDIDAAKNRYMSASEGARLLLGLEKEAKGKVVEPTTELVACARVGADDERILAAEARRIAETDFGQPLHCLIIPGELHFAEEQALARRRLGT